MLLTDLEGGQGLRPLQAAISSRNPDFEGGSVYHLMRAW